MSLNLAPWFYRNLLDGKELIEKPVFYKVTDILENSYYESNVWLKKPLGNEDCSLLYNDCDGSGADKNKNIAVYKAISEALERFAFHETFYNQNQEFSFDVNPTTTGMSAYPYINYSKARLNSIFEAIERWAIHQLNYRKIPVVKLENPNKDIQHYELITPFREKAKVSLVIFKKNDFYNYGFAASDSVENSFKKSLVELNRNLKILLKNDNYKLDYQQLDNSTDKSLIFFSGNEGFNIVDELIRSAPRRIIDENPRVICDKPIVGEWTKYTKVWRYLLEDSYFPVESDFKFFMF